MDLKSYRLKNSYIRVFAHKLGLGKKLKSTKYRAEVLSENIGKFAEEIDEDEKWLSSNSTRLDINKEFVGWRCERYEGVGYKSISLYDGEKLIAYFIVLVTKGRIKTAVKVVSFDILEEYIKDSNVSADFKKAAYTIGDLIDFYGMWNEEIEEKVVKIFEIEEKLESNYKFILKRFDEKGTEDYKLFVNHIDSEL